MSVTELDFFNSGRTDQADSVSGAGVSIVTTPVYTSGTRAANFFGGGLTELSYGLQRNSDGTADTSTTHSQVRMLCRVRFTSFPSPAAPEFAMIEFPGLSCRILPRSTGAIAIGTDNASNTLSTFTLSTATWYVFDILVNNTGTSYELRIYSADMATLHDTVIFVPSGGLSGSTVEIGKLVAVNTPCTYVMDGFMVDVDTPTSAIIVADFECVNKPPIDAGADQDWTGTFADIDEIPTTDTGDNINSSTALETSTFGLETNANVGIGASDQIVAVKPTQNMAQDSVEGTVNAIFITQGGDGFISGSLALTGTGVQRVSRVLDEKPYGGGGAWAPADLDAFDVGVRNNTTRAQPVRNYNQVTQVVFAPGVAPSDPPTKASIAFMFG